MSKPIFFEALKELDSINGWNAFEGPKFPKAVFFKHLKEAHPFVFDSRVSEEKLEASTDYKDVGKLVENFSLPFKTSLYVLSGSTTIHVKNQNTKMIPLGYLIHEITPETFRVYAFDLHETPPKLKDAISNKYLPLVDFFDIDLKKITKNEHEIALLIHLTNAISVKRIGVEKHFQTRMKNKFDLGGRTQIKYPNVLHIADKVEYEYLPSLGDGQIDWEFSGWWRGHWRAFYAYGPNGKIKDSYGWNVVDYGRIGKDRAGAYNVPGYTWVTEHIKGNKDVAEIKTHLVKAAGS